MDSPTTIAIRVTPRAKQNKVRPQADGSLKVYVTAPPEDGRANEAVVELIAQWLGVKRRDVEIVRGTTNRNKVVRITGVRKPRSRQRFPIDIPGVSY
jgi:uncharacterized protein (TIGR00251 family)